MEKTKTQSLLLVSKWARARALTSHYCLQLVQQHLISSIPSIHTSSVITIGSKCPGISGTVPDLAVLSLVPEGPSTSLLFVQDLRKTVVLTCYSAKLAHYGFNNN